jgi:hydroxymethylbilane synthase
VLARRADFELALLRGNVPTRVRKLDEGQYDAIVLAAAGLRRLEMGDRITEVLTPEVCLPAVGQGALGIETRAGDDVVIDLVRRAVHHEGDARRVVAERTCLARLGGSCQTPLAAFAQYADDGRLTIDGLVAEPDGTRVLRATTAGPAEDAQALGEALADDLLAQGAKAIIDACEAS